MIGTRMAPLAAALALVALPATAAEWQVAAEASTLGFASIKNGEIAETHEFGALSGKIAEGGKAEIAVSLASVETRIDIRNERMREILFDVATHPFARITAEIELGGFAELEIGERTGARLPITVAANGQTVDYEAQVNVTRIGEDRVSVSAAEPVVVHAADLGYGAGVEKLREIAGLESISPVVPVTFDIVLTR